MGKSHQRASAFIIVQKNSTLMHSDRSPETELSKVPAGGGCPVPYTVMTTISGSTSALRMPSMATSVPVRPAGQVVQAPW